LRARVLTGWLGFHAEDHRRQPRRRTEHPAAEPLTPSTQPLYRRTGNWRSIVT
jgi:hypothetical protein